MVEVIEPKVWTPHRKQEDFLSLPDSIHEAFYGGAAAGGKSEVLLMLPIARSFYKYSKFKGLLLRRTFPELEKSLILRSNEWYRPAGGEYNRQLHRWRFSSGAIVDFGYAEHEQDVRRYDTTEYNYIAFDELTSFTEFQYVYLAMSRCRTSDDNLPAIVRSASNPGNVGHGWVRKRFVEPSPDGGVIIRDRETLQKRIFIKALVTDNKPFMARDPDYVNRLRMLPEAERKAKLDGDWWTFSGQVFDDWRLQPFPDEPNNAKHVVEPFPIPEYWPRILAVDWGFSAMTWAGWFAASPDGRAYLYREYTCKGVKISTWATDVGRLCKNENIRDAVLDPSAWQNTGVDKTVAIQFIEYSGISPRPADNDRIGGKILMQEYLRWQPKPVRSLVFGSPDMENAQRILRWHGLDEYNRYLAQFKPEAPESNLPKLQVFSSCQEFIKAIALCVYDENNKEDVKEFDGDDPYDGCRYGIKAIDRFYNLSSKESAAVMKKQEILQSFEQTKDWNALYRRMEYLEKEIAHKNRPLRRFHGRRVA